MKAKILYNLWLGYNKVKQLCYYGYSNVIELALIILFVS